MYGNDRVICLGLYRMHRKWPDINGISGINPRQVYKNKVDSIFSWISQDKNGSGSGSNLDQTWQ